MRIVTPIEAVYYASSNSSGDRKNQEPIPVERSNKDTRGQSFETVLLNYIQLINKKEEKRNDEH